MDPPGSIALCGRFTGSETAARYHFDMTPISLDIVTPAATPIVHGSAWLYILAANGAEDLLKVGLTGDPLSRWSALHPRWYEAFDLSHSLLVACETRADAQALETRLHRDLVEHACTMPLTMRSAAGGFTEWYRGAYA